MNKKIKIGLFVFIFIGVIVLNITYKNKTIKTNRKSNLAIMIKGESGEYVSSNEIPKGIITAQYVGRLFVANGSTIYGSKLNDLDNFEVSGSGTGDAIEKTVESKVNALKVFYDDQNNLRLLSFTADNKIEYP